MKNPSDIIQYALKQGRAALFEHEAKGLARAAGIVVPRSEVVEAQDETGLLDAAERLGFPLALKAVSPQILHKTEAGAVALDIKDKATLIAAVKQIRDSVAARARGAVIQFFLLEKMMPPGLELLVGGLRDGQFGPAVAFGLGGVWVEALEDAVFGILPMSRQEMTGMMAETKAGIFLKGFRNSPPLDQDAVLSVIDAVGKLLTDHPAIKEIEINPLRAYPGSAAALDVRVILAAP